VALVVLGAELYLAWSYRRVFRSVLSAKNEPARAAIAAEQPRAAHA
jgi:hypothetical protein